MVAGRAGRTSRRFRFLPTTLDSADPAFFRRTPNMQPLPDKIPKVIHYCWFSGEPMPKLARRCMQSWERVMPDYQLRLWDANSFEFDSVAFVGEAFRRKRWAFVADYVRLYALHQEGGIYLDSDVEVFRRFDPFLKYEFFTSHELHPVNFTAAERMKLDPQGRVIDPSAYVYGLNVQAAIMGGAKDNPFLADCLRFYEIGRLTFADGGTDLRTMIIGPFISKVAESHGYRYVPSEQHLAGNMAIFPPEVFVGNDAFQTDQSYAAHLISGSWIDRSRYERFKYWARNQCAWLLPVLGLWERFVRMLTRPFRPGSSLRRTAAAIAIGRPRRHGRSR